MVARLASRPAALAPLVVLAVLVPPAGISRPATVTIVFQLAQPRLANARAISSSLPGALPSTLPEVLPGGRFALKVAAPDAGAAQAVLGKTAGVNYVSPVGEVHESALSGVIPDNPCYISQCGPDKPVVVEDPAVGVGATVVHPNGQTDLWAINAGQAWEFTKGSPSILVAVLDTGVDTRHPQLIGKVVQGPNECAHDRPDCSSDLDANGHGTFVAGLIAAATNDGLGIAGLGWATRVLDIKVLGESGNGNTLDEANGIYAAVAAGAKVINLSSTNEPCGRGVAPIDCGPNVDQEKAVEYAIAHGVVVVAAAGNNLSGKPVYPADYPGVLSVAASTDDAVVDPNNGGSYLDFSNYGTDANLAAPGIDVLSTWYDGNYAVESGTSYAAPHVAATAALMLAANPSLSGPQVATLLQETASPLLPGGKRIDGGFLNAGAAVQAAAERRTPHTLDGYLLAGSEGQTAVAGSVGQEGSLSRPLSSPVVGAAETRKGLGYWLATAGGAVFTFGDARFYGSAAGRHLSAPVVAMAAAPDDRGYWLVTSAGQVLGFGQAHVYGSAPPGSRAKPVVGMAVAPSGRGYWLVRSDGDVLAYGDAHLYGSPARSRLHLAAPIVGMAASPDGRGYWLVGADGGVFNYGDAGWYGTASSGPPGTGAGTRAGTGQRVIGIAPSPDGLGYWLASQSGRVWAFGSAPYEVGPIPEPRWPVVAFAS
jgi:subtilisin family serine protease